MKSLLLFRPEQLRQYVSQDLDRTAEHMAHHLVLAGSLPVLDGPLADISNRQLPLTDSQVAHVSIVAKAFIFVKRGLHWLEMLPQNAIPYVLLAIDPEHCSPYQHPWLLYARYRLRQIMLCKPDKCEEGDLYASFITSALHNIDSTSEEEGIHTRCQMAYELGCYSFYAENWADAQAYFKIVQGSNLADSRSAWTYFRLTQGHRFRAI